MAMTGSGMANAIRARIGDGAGTNWDATIPELALSRIEMLTKFCDGIIDHMKSDAEVAGLTGDSVTLPPPGNHAHYGTNMSIA